MVLMGSLAFNDTPAGALPPVDDVGRASQDQIQSPTLYIFNGDLVTHTALRYSHTTQVGDRKVPRGNHCTVLQAWAG